MYVFFFFGGFVGFLGLFLDLVGWLLCLWVGFGCFFEVVGCDFCLVLGDGLVLWIFLGLFCCLMGFLLFKVLRSFLRVDVVVEFFFGKGVVLGDGLVFVLGRGCVFSLIIFLWLECCFESFLFFNVLRFGYINFGLLFIFVSNFLRGNVFLFWCICLMCFLRFGFLVNFFVVYL